MLNPDALKVCAIDRASNVDYTGRCLTIDLALGRVVANLGVQDGSAKLGFGSVGIVMHCVSLICRRMFA